MLINITTQFGNFYLILDDQERVIESGFGSAESKDCLIADSHKYIKIIKDYLSGKDDISKIRFLIKGTDFSKKVLLEMTRIKYGKTISYKQLAIKSGYPKAYRAVGSVCKNNQIPIIIPCHRVIKASGDLGEYAFGSQIKKKLINLEGQSNARNSI